MILSKLTATEAENNKKMIGSKKIKEHKELSFSDNENANSDDEKSQK